MPMTNKMWLNSLPSDKILDWSKLKAFADDKLNVAKTLKIHYDKEENIVERGENAGLLGKGLNRWILSKEL